MCRGCGFVTACVRVCLLVCAYVLVCVSVVCSKVFVFCALMFVNVCLCVRARFMCNAHVLVCQRVRMRVLMYV